MKGAGLVAAIAAVASVSILGGALARPVVPAERRIIPYTANLPECDNADVLDRLSSRFEEKESKFWNSDLRIVGYDRVGAYAWRANGRDSIPRRYCAARVLMSNEHHYWANYAIAEDLGIIGFGFGIPAYRFGLEWCIAGLDRSWAYGSGCMSVRPMAERLRRGALSLYRSRNLSVNALSAPKARPIKPLPLPAAPSSAPAVPPGTLTPLASPPPATTAPAASPNATPTPSTP